MTAWYRERSSYKAVHARLIGLGCHILSEFFGDAVTTHDKRQVHRKYYTAFDPCPCHYDKQQNCMRYGLLVLRLSYVGFCRVLLDRSSTSDYSLVGESVQRNMKTQLLQFTKDGHTHCLRNVQVID